MLNFDDLAVGPAPQLPLEAFQRRRERVLDALNGEGLLVATHAETVYSNDVEPRFRPGSDFWYLTGFAEPEAAVLFDGDVTLFCRERDPKKEVWNGRRTGVERAKSALGVDRVRPFDELGSAIDGAQLRAITDHHPEVDEVVTNHAAGTDPGGDVVHKLRLRKEDAELALLRHACDVGADAMREALPLARAGTPEYVIEAALLVHYRRAGSTGAGYPPIVGAGANASILHYIENKHTVGAGDMVLVDAGCEWGYYNSDITRTVPADGRFADAQADLYGLVHDAQKAALAVVAPGRTLGDVHEAASKVLADGLIERGWIREPGELNQFYMHGTSHFLGLDVHDVGRYKIGGASRKLEPGMVITVEPGLYANPDYASLPAGVEPMGIRLENDVVVTADGYDDLLAGLPTDIDGVERLLQKG